VPGRILVVDDERGVRTLCADLLARAGYDPVTASSAEEALGIADREAFDIVLADVNLGGMDGIELCKRLRAQKPEQLVILITAYPSIENAVRGMKEGARDYVTKPFSPDELRLVIARALEERALRQENAELREKLAFGGIIGGSKALQDLLRTVEKVARADATVLVVGESGTGKELFARAIHYHGPRASRPFVAVNCGALVGTLLESELFGHVRGAFTGAQSAKRGLFVAADRGTLFLDEIGELSPELQPKLLRALQEGEIKPVGGIETQKVDVRVVAATNRDLREDVRAGRFREDLYYRLNVITLEIPPLRERPEDIPPLIEHFVARAATRARKPAPEVSAEAMEVLRTQPWPGNVRELANAVERAVVLGGDVLGPADFAGRASPRIEAVAKSEDYPFIGMSLEDLERTHIERVLNECGGQKGRAAEILGINRTTLWKKLRQYGYE
jgi:DNA-binding NtrC family response regulator